MHAPRPHVEETEAEATRNRLLTSLRTMHSLERMMADAISQVGTPPEHLDIVFVDAVIITYNPQDHTHAIWAGRFMGAFKALGACVETEVELKTPERVERLEDR